MTRSLKNYNQIVYNAPIFDPPIPLIKISPLGIVPKKSPGQFMMIHHLSFPDKKEGSVNAGMS